MMEKNISIPRLNEFLRNHVFYVPLFIPGFENQIITKLKVIITGVEDYIYAGESKSSLEYTLIILPSNSESDWWYSMLSNITGNDVKIKTTSMEYLELRFHMNSEISNFLKYFGFNMEVICTRIVNEIKPSMIKESIILEGILDKTTRVLVKDILSFFKNHREGEWELPYDLHQQNMTYDLPGFEGFNVSIILNSDENMKGIDVDGNLYYEDDVLEIIITSNPKDQNLFLSELTHELNEVVRHELEHIKQHNSDYKFPKREPKHPEKYYTQHHELEAQRAGFKKRSKSEKKDYEQVIRSWFDKNKHKHRLTPEEIERVIGKILNSK
jgi:hypothetical protein